MENKVIRTIKSRTSTRSYTDRRVPLKKLEAILEAGKYAPSAKNRQICKILAIRNKRYVATLTKIDNEVTGRGFYGATTLALVYGPREDAFTVQDASCILENMFIAAEALGIASCWINQVDDALNSKEGLKLRKKLGLTPDDRVVGTCILGYTEEKGQVKPRNEDMIKII